MIFFLGATGGIGALVAWPSANSNHTPMGSRITANPVASIAEAVHPSASAALLEPTAEKQASNSVNVPVPVFSAKPSAARLASSTSASKTTEESADSLVAETQRLREAHGALRGGDPEKALALLSEQAAEGEGQKLREERAAARVLALCKLGRVDEANTEAAAFLVQNPRSPLADRVRNACPNGR